MEERTVPERLERDRNMRVALQEHLGTMERLVESRRISLDDPDAHTDEPRRALKHCVAVLVWENPDGTESTEIVGDLRSQLELKGLLHDGIYLLAHQGEQT